MNDQDLIEQHRHQSNKHHSVPKGHCHQSSDQMPLQEYIKGEKSQG